MSFLCAIPVLAGLVATCASEEPLAVGYVEGDYVLLAPSSVAQLEEVAVERGDRIKAGETVAVLETSDAEIAVRRAEAQLAEAEARLADLKEPRRPEEIAVLEAALKSAEAEAGETERVRVRFETLFARGTASRADVDQARTKAELAEARLGQAKANLDVARLPARPEAIRAAARQRDQMRAVLEEARWRLAERRVHAPAEGRVFDVIRKAGEQAGPTAPVISLLPDGAVKLKLYVPETAFSGITPGARLAVNCDNCPSGLYARISYISPEPEFTPPVIYSLETRQKLVYLIEARPESGAAHLQPGQIVDVRLAASLEGSDAPDNR